MAIPQSSFVPGGVLVTVHSLGEVSDCYPFMIVNEHSFPHCLFHRVIGETTCSVGPAEDGSISVRAEDRTGVPPNLRADLGGTWLYLPFLGFPQL